MSRGRPRKDHNLQAPAENEEANAIENEAEAIDRQEEPAERPKKKGTPPGWRPAGQMPRLKAPSGFTAKWANPEKLTKHLAEGWQIMKPKDNRGDPIIRVDVNDSASMTDEIRFRDSIAIMLPNELKQARDEWVRKENRDAMSSILKQTDDQLTDMGVETYKPNGQEGRIVIE